MPFTSGSSRVFQPRGIATALACRDRFARVPVQFSPRAVRPLCAKWILHILEVSTYTHPTIISDRWIPLVEIVQVICNSGRSLNPTDSASGIGKSSRGIARQKGYPRRTRGAGGRNSERNPRRESFKLVVSRPVTNFLRVIPSTGGRVVLRGPRNLVCGVRDFEITATRRAPFSREKLARKIVDKIRRRGGAVSPSPSEAARNRGILASLIRREASCPPMERGKLGC